MSSDLKQKTISGVLWSGVQKFGSLAISFISNLVLARLLSPEDYGCIGMLFIFIVLSKTFVDGGFGAALVQKKDATEDDFSTIFYWNILSSLILYIVLFISAPFIAKFYDMPQLCDILRVFGIVIIINSTYIVQANKLIKELNFKLYSFSTLVSVSISTIIGIVLAYAGWGVWSLVIKEIVTAICASIFLWYYCKWKPLLRFSTKSFKSLFNYGSMILLATFVNKLYENIQGLIIGKAFSAKDLGLYTQAKKIEEIPVTSFSDMITQVTFPVYSSISTQKDYLKNVIRKNIKVVNFITFGIMSLLIIIAEPLFIILFTEKWIESVPLFKILCFAGMVIPLNNVNTQLFKGVGRSDIFFILQFVKRVLGIIIILLSVRWGVLAMMYAIVINNYLFYIMNCIYTKKVLAYSVSEQLKDILPNLFVVMGLIYIGNNINLEFASSFECIIYMCIISVIYAILYFIICYLLKFEGTIYFLNLIKEKIIKRK